MGSEDSTVGYFQLVISHTSDMERSELSAFLQSFEVGSLVSYEGITAGIENTNYFVTTSVGEFVLTVFEFTQATELPFFLELMGYLAEQGIASAHPLADENGRYLQRLKGKPAVLVHRLKGASVTTPDVGHCAAIGAAMARMHQAADGFSGYRANDRGPQWQTSTVKLVLPKLNRADRALLKEALSERRSMCCDTLPTGVIHADLFRDNALFESHDLSGIIDFYYAHNGPLIYDLAVTVVDWCLNARDEFAASEAGDLVKAYDEIRSVSDDERESWSYHVRATGLRFWLSRLKDTHFPRVGSLTHAKDPEPFKQVLLAGRDALAAINKVWT